MLEGERGSHPSLTRTKRSAGPPLSVALTSPLSPLSLILCFAGAVRARVVAGFLVFATGRSPSASPQSTAAVPWRRHLQLSLLSAVSRLLFAALRPHAHTSEAQQCHVLRASCFRAAAALLLPCCLSSACCCVAARDETEPDDVKRQMRAIPIEMSRRAVSAVSMCVVRCDFALRTATALPARSFSVGFGARSNTAATTERKAKQQHAAATTTQQQHARNERQVSGTQQKPRASEKRAAKRTCERAERDTQGGDCAMRR